MPTSVVTSKSTGNHKWNFDIRFPSEWGILVKAGKAIVEGQVRVLEEDEEYVVTPDGRQTVMGYLVLTPEGQVRLMVDEINPHELGYSFITGELDLLTKIFSIQLTGDESRLIEGDITIFTMETLDAYRHKRKSRAVPKRS